MIFKIPKGVKLSKSERVLIDFIESNPELVLKLSMDQLSSRCYLSKATISRFIKNIGIDGYSNFKIQLAKEISKIPPVNNVDNDLPIKEHFSSKEVAKSIFDLHQQNIHNSYNNLDLNEIEAVANLIHSSDNIYLYGRGESLIVAQDLHYKLLRLGKNSILETSNGFQEVKNHNSNNRNLKNCSIVFSYYCDSQQANFIIDELICSEIPIILITSNLGAERFGSLVNHIFTTPELESRTKLGSFSSRNSMLFIIDCLYGFLLTLDYTNNINSLSNSSVRKSSRNFFYKE